MDTKTSLPIEQTLPIQERGAAGLVVSQPAEGKLERISEERIYEENAKVAAIFWEWRHKIMTHFFAGMAALIALISWLYQQPGISRIWLCAPLLLGAVFSFVSYLLDTRNKRILERCYRIGKDIDYSREGGGIFSFLDDLHYTGGSYSQILKSLYLVSALVLLVLSIIVILVAWWGAA